eukprot:8113859-Lingulodinium_polyedra.AAC.1
MLTTCTPSFTSAASRGTICEAAARATACWLGTIARLRRPAVCRRSSCEQTASEAALYLDRN